MDAKFNRLFTDSVTGAAVASILNSHHTILSFVKADRFVDWIITVGHQRCHDDTVQVRSTKTFPCEENQA